jgi:hypothetical protein
MRARRVRLRHASALHIVNGLMVWRLEISPPTLLVTTRAVKSIPADHKNVLYLDALNSMSYSPFRSYSWQQHLERRISML